MSTTRKKRTNKRRTKHTKNTRNTRIRRRYKQRGGHSSTPERITEVLLKYGQVTPLGRAMRREGITNQIIEEIKERAKSEDHQLNDVEIGKEVLSIHKEIDKLVRSGEIRRGQFDHELFYI